MSSRDRIGNFAVAFSILFSYFFFYSFFFYFAWICFSNNKLTYFARRNCMWFDLSNRQKAKNKRTHTNSKQMHTNTQGIVHFVLYRTSLNHKLYYGKRNCGCVFVRYRQKRTILLGFIGMFVAGLHCPCITQCGIHCTVHKCSGVHKHNIWRDWDTKHMHNNFLFTIHTTSSNPNKISGS